MRCDTSRYLQPIGKNENHAFLFLSSRSKCKFLFGIPLSSRSQTQWSSSHKCDLKDCALSSGKRMASSDICYALSVSPPALSMETHLEEFEPLQAASPLIGRLAFNNTSSPHSVKDSMKSIPILTLRFQCSWQSSRHPISIPACKKTWRRQD